MCRGHHATEHHTLQLRLSAGHESPCISFLLQADFQWGHSPAFPSPSMYEDRLSLHSNPDPSRALFPCRARLLSLSLSFEKSLVQLHVYGDSRPPAASTHQPCQPTHGTLRLHVCRVIRSTFALLPHQRSALDGLPMKLSHMGRGGGEPRHNLGSCGLAGTSSVNHQRRTSTTSTRPERIRNSLQRLALQVAGSSGSRQFVSSPVARAPAR